MSMRKIDFMTLLEDYFETYLPYSRGLSPNMIKSYKQSFLLLIRFMLDVKKTKAEDIRFSALTYDTLLEFLGWLETDNAKPLQGIKVYLPFLHFPSMCKTGISMRHLYSEVRLLKFR